jgi:hypothetical protein
MSNWCSSYFYFLLWAGGGAIILGILLGVALAIASIVLLMRKAPPAVEIVGPPAPANVTAVLDAMKSFLQALSAAPTWLALFGGGVLLVWLAGDAAPQQCACPTDQTHCTRPG